MKKIGKIHTIGSPLLRSSAQWPKKIGIVLIWLAAWELTDRLVHNRIILVGPVHLVTALVDQVGKDDFWAISSASFLRIAIGFLLSFASGFLLAMGAYRFALLKEFLEPAMVALKTVPMISFVIMLLIWVGNQALTVYLSFLIVLPIIYTNTLAGFRNADREMLEMAAVYRLAAWKRFLYIYRPAFMPFLMSSSRVSLGMSWKSGIMAEVIGTPKPSIGREMYAAKSYLQTANLFAWTVIVIVLSIVFEKAFMLLLTKLNKPLGSRIGRGK
ncbi:ABC transporter permease subunit [Cohnella fermenti]|uniref:ABC transporter permease subunit n=2 Tax=Cohnella fermenti TaxID=2565925 RepID=A0A4S4C7S1_9BACL|nr:ABC transporter permease subunit [Cohnella fermenti]